MIPFDWPAFLWRMVGMVVSLGLVFGAGFVTEMKLRDAADDRRIAAEAIAERDRVVRIEREKEADDHKAAALASYYEAERQKREAIHASTQAKLRNALSSPISCPGGSLADVMLPAAVVGSLRDAAGQGGTAAAEPAASEPGR